MDTYFISQSKGSDRNDGIAAPWKTFANTDRLRPGDTLLLQRGDCWTEELTLRVPCTVDAFGEGARPHIRRSIEEKSRCVTLCSDGVSLRSLELSDAWYGVEIVMNREVKTAWSGYRFESCWFHDIRNRVFPHDQSKGADLTDWPWAIHKRLDAQSDGCILTDCAVRNCVAEHCQGFWSTQYAEGGNGSGQIDEQRIAFEHNTFRFCYYNNLYFCNVCGLRFTQNLLEYAYPNHNHWPYGNTFIVSGSPFPGHRTEDISVTDNLFQYAGDIPGGADGCFYDLEFSQRRTTLARNTFRHAFGEGFLVMPYADVADFAFEDNTVEDTCLYCQNRDMTVDLLNERGTGAFRRNRFTLPEGVRAFSAKPAGYTFEQNDERAPRTASSDPDCGANWEPERPLRPEYVFEAPGVWKEFTVEAGETGVRVRAGDALLLEDLSPFAPDDSLRVELWEGQPYLWRNGRFVRAGFVPSEPIPRKAAIRPFRPSDAEELRAICLGNSSSKRDDDRKRTEVLSSSCNYYIEREPTHMRVAADAFGHPVGYVFCADRFDDFWPVFAREYASRRAVYGRESVRSALADYEPHERWKAEYPAHLHIDVLPAWQRGGLGHQLVDALCERLRRDGVSGLMLTCGAANAVGQSFYRRYGFCELERGDGYVAFGLRL